MQEKRNKQLDDATKKGHGFRDIMLLKLITDHLGKHLTEEEKKTGLPRAKVNDLVSLYALRRSYYERFIQDCDDPEPLLMMFCQTDDLDRYAQISDPNEGKNFLFDKCGTHLFAAWQLATTLSGGLVKGENSLSATEAYWLGIIEEVVGDSSLLSKRQFQESRAVFS